jgi:hypothetical protein
MSKFAQEVRPQHGLRSERSLVPKSESSLTQLTGSMLLQRKCACGGTSGPNGECEECRKKREFKVLQRRTGHSSSLIEPCSQVPPIVHEVLRSTGQPLDAQTRALMEQRFGHDFGQVRVHVDAPASESARTVNAVAYTVGRDVVFDAGQYAPRTSKGRRLLTHELTHVVQQGHHASDNRIGLAIGPTDDLYEQEADRAADALVHDRIPTSISKLRTFGARSKVLQRQVSSSNPAPATHSLPNGIEDLKGRDFDGVFRLDAISVIEFRTDCCQPCEELAQWLSGLAQKFRGVEHPFRVRFLSLNASPMVVDPATGHCIDELSSPEADENRAVAKRLGIAGGFPHLHIYVERKLAKAWSFAPPIEVIEEALKDVIEDASMSGAEKGFHLGLGRSTLGWALPILLLPIAGLAALGGALFGKEKGTKQLSEDKLQKVKDFGEGKIKPEDLDHSLAEDVVNFWVNHRETFKLDIDQRRLLIKNLISGFTGDAEERAILKIIENSSDSEILQIFSLSDPEAPNLLELEAEFQGEEREYLDELLRHLRDRFPVNPPQEKTTGLLINDSFVQGVLAAAFRNTHRQQPNKPFVQRECCGVFITSAQSTNLDKEDKCEEGKSCETGIIARDALKRRGKGFQIAGSFHTHPVAFPPQAREAPSAADFKVFFADPARGKEHYVVGPLVTYLIKRDGTFRILGNTADLLHVERIQPKPGQVSTLELG